MSLATKFPANVVRYGMSVSYVITTLTKLLLLFWRTRLPVQNTKIVAQARRELSSSFSFQTYDNRQGVYLQCGSY